MKYLLLLSVCLTSSLWADAGKEAWQYSTRAGKAKILAEYREFFRSIPEKDLGNFSDDEISYFRFLIDEAHAENNYNCIYAGWPSVRNGSSCSSPQKNNADYKTGSCGAGQMQCQPLLFGKGLCAPVATKQQRNSAFSNCEKKLRASGRSPESIVKEIQADGNEKLLFELLDFADKICREGKQAGTGMCNRLTAAVNRIRKENPEEKLDVVASTEAQVRSPAISSPVVTPAVDPQKPAIEEAVEKVNEANEIVKAGPVVSGDCDPVSEGTPFERDVPREDFPFTSMSSVEGGKWSKVMMMNASGTKVPGGFNFINRGPNEIAGPAINPNQVSDRTWTFYSKDNSRSETFLWLTDSPGGKNSDLMDSLIVLLPRKMVPSIESKNDKVIVTLTTGEKFAYDPQTKIIKEGVLSEGKVDTNPDRFKRKFADVNYSGSGIMIRINHRGEDPRIKAATATVTQNGKTCTIPTGNLWNQTDGNTSFKFSDDQKLVQMLNSKCSKAKFKL